MESTGEPCPTFKYKIPLLDKTIADLLARGLVKKLDWSKTTSNQSIVVPHQHLNIEEDAYEVIQRNCSEESEESEEVMGVNKLLDAFSIRNLKEVNIGFRYSASFTPELIQAMLDLEEDKENIYILILKDVIHWNVDENSQYLDILKTMWHFESFDGCTNIKEKMNLEYGDISIKLKPFIEKILLESTSEMLECKIIVDDEWFRAKKDLERLVQITSVTSECFQICCSILNAIFIKTKCDTLMIQYNKSFIKAVKFYKECITQLYPYDLQNIVLLLDIDLNDFKRDIREKYIEFTLDCLKLLHRECESDLIMLLSHFNQWFDIYYESNRK